MQPPNMQRPWPAIWLMTDERNDGVLEKSAERLPRESGIIFRHYHLGQAARAKRFDAVKKIARQQNHILLLADTPALAKAWGADGVHGRQWRRAKTKGLLHSAPVHNIREINNTKKNGADIFFLSPAFPTRSHPNGKTLGALQLRRMIRLCGGPVILLGGMNARRSRQYQSLGAYGWAAIDALSRLQTNN